MDVNRLLLDLCQVLDPVKRNELRTLVQELKAKKAAREIPSVTQALVEQAPAVVGADLWRECCEKQRPRGDTAPGPAAAGGGEDASPPDPSSEAPGNAPGVHKPKENNAEARTARRRSASSATRDGEEAERPARARTTGPATGAA